MAALSGLPYVYSINNMKVFKHATVVVFLLIGVSASAQFAQSRSDQFQSSARNVYNTADFTYSPLTVSVNFGLNYTVDLHAVSLNWAQYRLLTDNVPVYIQYGAGLQYTFGEGDFFGTDEAMSFLSIKVPVSAVYQFDIPNLPLLIVPYAGLNLQGYILGKGVSTYEDFETGETKTTTYDYFSKEQMGDESLNRIVLGWQIGARVMYDMYFLGVGYEGPVTSLYKEENLKINTSQVNISIGIRF